MKKDFIVIFREDGSVRIEKDPAKIAEHKGKANVFFNPIIPKGTPPHEWKQKDLTPKPKFKRVLELVLFLAALAGLVLILTGCSSVPSVCPDSQALQIENSNLKSSLKESEEDLNACIEITNECMSLSP